MFELRQDTAKSRWCRREFKVPALVAVRRQEPIPTDRDPFRKTGGAYHGIDHHPCKSGAVPWILVLQVPTPQSEVRFW